MTSNSQTIDFKYTNFIFTTLYIAAYTLPFFFLLLYIRENLPFPYLLILKSLWLTVLIAFLVSFAGYETFVWKFAERKGTACMGEESIVIEYARSSKTILYKDLAKVEYKPHLGSWYALVITTKDKQKISINESQGYSKTAIFNTKAKNRLKENLQSPLYTLCQMLNKQIN